MPNASKKNASSIKQPPFVPPPEGQLPPNYRPAVHTSVRANDSGNIIDAEWTTFAQVDPKTGARTGNLPYWFTSNCVIRNDKSAVRLVRLRDIGAQPRNGTVRLRVTGTKKLVVTLSDSSGGRGKPVKPVKGFYPIEASQCPDGSPSNKYYTLLFRDPICFLECYNILPPPPKNPCPPGGPPVSLAVYGYPPPGTPE